MGFKNGHQFVVLHGGKELPDIALQYPDRSSVIASYLLRESFESIESFMYALSVTTGVRVMDKGSIKEWI